jgi:hypothetical protein
MSSAPATAPHGSPRDLDRIEALHRRAMVIWPRLDASALRRCGDDVTCVATLVLRRTALPQESIIGILTAPFVSEDEGQTWFG